MCNPETRAQSSSRAEWVAASEEKWIWAPGGELVALWEGNTFLPVEKPHIFTRDGAVLF